MHIFKYLEDMMRKVSIGLLFVSVLLFISCERNIENPPIVEQESLSVFWENASVRMNIGDIKELRWDSSRPIQPRVHSGGSTVVITGMTENGVQIMAIENGMDVVSLFIEGKEIVCIVMVNEDTFVIDEPEDATLLDSFPVKIIVPYTKKFLSIGQETAITVNLENGGYEDELNFTFSREQGKNCIVVEEVSNVAIIKAIGEGVQYLLISHPKAVENKIVIYDVLPPALPSPPVIDVSESPLIIRKGETKPLTLVLLNGKKPDMEKFEFQVIENAYSLDVKQKGSILNVTGIAPGVGKIRIRNPATLRDYDVMVIVD
jgi:hypothetical protein